MEEHLTLNLQENWCSKALKCLLLLLGYKMHGLRPELLAAECAARAAGCFNSLLMSEKCEWALIPPTWQLGWLIAVWVPVWHTKNSQGKNSLNSWPSFTYSQGPTGVIGAKGNQVSDTVLSVMSFLQTRHLNCAKGAQTAFPALGCE